jgi:hypothetical protein
VAFVLWSDLEFYSRQKDGRGGGWIIAEVYLKNVFAG